MEFEPLPRRRGIEEPHVMSIQLDFPYSFYHAIQQRNIEALKDLIDANLDLYDYISPCGDTALMVAITEIRHLSLMHESNDNKMIQIKILEEMMKLLLEAGCSANIPDKKGHTPIFHAAYQGLRKVIEMIIFYANEPIDKLFQPVAGKTLLHVTVRGKNSFFISPTADFNWCLDLFLNSSKINVDHIDNNNNTALHYAALNGDDETVLKLLRHGACVSLRNNRNELVLEAINARTLGIYLDECIRARGKRFKPSDDDYEISMNYALFFNTNLSSERKICEQPIYENTKELSAVASTSTTTLTTETDALLYMTQSEELRPLLKHPVITSFLYLKWHRIRSLAYANITTYSMLWLFLMLYIIFGYGVKRKQSNYFQTLNSVTYVVVIIGLILLIIRELFQLLLSPVRYLKGYENWIEIVLIGIITWIVCHESEHVSIKQQLSAVAILISSMELLLLIGQIPASSTNMLMLKTVSWNFFKFLLWYCLLIIAFALSFYTLFRQVEDDQTPPPQNLNSTEKEESEALFSDPFRSLFKTIVMLTGEFDAGSIPFNTFPITSHIIFIVFVFMIPIVLFSLLNGLAVSDTQKIRADAELVGLISRVKFISYFESLLIGNAKAFKRSTKCWSWLTTHLQAINTCRLKLRAICIKPLAKHIFLFPYILPGYRIIVKPNKDNKIIIPQCKDSQFFVRLDDSFGGLKEFKGKLDGNIVQNAKIIINKKKNVTELNEIKAVLFKNEEKLASLDTTNKSLEKKIENVETILNSMLQTLERM